MMSKVKEVVNFLALQERDEIGDAWTNGQTILDETKLSVYEINDAVEIAKSRKYVEIKIPPPNYKPWKFSSITITALGRLWLEEKMKSS